MKPDQLANHYLALKRWSNTLGAAIVGQADCLETYHLTKDASRAVMASLYNSGIESAKQHLDRLYTEMGY